jgi:hypothetical protein
VLLEGKTIIVTGFGGGLRRTFEHVFSGLRDPNLDDALT